MNFLAIAQAPLESPPPLVVVGKDGGVGVVGAVGVEGTVGVLGIVGAVGTVGVGARTGGVGVAGVDGNVGVVGGVGEGAVGTPTQSNEVHPFSRNVHTKTSSTSFVHGRQSEQLRKAGQTLFSKTLQRVESGKEPSMQSKQRSNCASDTPTKQRPAVLI